MIKSIQFKIIVVFFLIGIIIITGLGVVYIHSINNLEVNLSNREIENNLKFISNKQRILMLTLIAILIISPLMLNPIDDAGAHIARIEYL